MSKSLKEILDTRTCEENMSLGELWEDVAGLCSRINRWNYTSYSVEAREVQIRSIKVMIEEIELCHALLDSDF